LQSCNGKGLETSVTLQEVLIFSFFRFKASYKIWHVHVHMYVCVCVCVCTYTFVCMRACICMEVFAYVWRPEAHTAVFLSHSLPYLLPKHLFCMCVCKEAYTQSSEKSLIFQRADPGNQSQVFGPGGMYFHQLSHLTYHLPCLFRQGLLTSLMLAG